MPRIIITRYAKWRPETGAPRCDDQSNFRGANMSASSGMCTPHGSAIRAAKRRGQSAESRRRTVGIGMWGPCSPINRATLAFPRRGQKLQARSTLARCCATSPSRIEPPAGNSARPPGHVARRIPATMDRGHGSSLSSSSRVTVQTSGIPRRPGGRLLTMVIARLEELGRCRS
jgi:hypothetical protein